jgi:phage terminase small subunit
MRGRKPKIDNVIPMVPDAAGGGALDAAREAAIRRAVDKMRPSPLTPELRKEWNRVATILADPIVDRLKPRFVDVILEYCRICVRLRQIRAEFDKMAKAAKTPTTPLQAEVVVAEGRHGTQVKSHAHVAQMNEAWRQWRSLVAMLGLSPADERNMLPGQGDLFDESEREFA